MIDFDFTELSDAEVKTAYVELDALQKRCKEAMEQAKQVMLDRLGNEPENAMIGKQIIATVTRIKGGSRTTYKVKDPIMYAKWLDDVEAELHGKRATTTVRYPKDETMEQDYLTMLVHQGGGELPRGVTTVKPRADSIRVNPSPDLMGRLFSGDLTPAFQQLLLTDRKDTDNDK